MTLSQRIQTLRKQQGQEQLGSPGDNCGNTSNSSWAWKEIPKPLLTYGALRLTYLISRN